MEIDINQPIAGNNSDQSNPVKGKVIRFTVSLPEELLQTLDNNVIHKGYASRSEFIRDLIREQIVEDEWQEQDTEVTGVLTLVYDQHQRDLIQRIAEIQQSIPILTICATKIHLDHRNCLENIIIKGGARDVNRASMEIGGIRGIKFAKMTKASRFSV